MATTLVGYFEDYNEAKQTETDLLQSGFQPDDVTVVSQPETEEAQQAREAQAAEAKDRGFWQNLKYMLGLSSEEERSTYEEATRRGGIFVTVRAPEERVDEAADIIERHHPIDLDQRVQEWRAGGWSAYPTTTPTATTTAPAAESTAPQPVEQPQAAATPHAQETIPLAEEELKVGKRAIRRGGVRIHKYVVEEPVEQDVALREEDVRVERRRTAERPTEPGQGEPFEERTIEVTSTREEPVVTKEAKVVEEVVVDKDVREKVDTVRDTVRRTEVEVEPKEGK